MADKCICGQREVADDDRYQDIIGQTFCSQVCLQDYGYDALSDMQETYEIDRNMMHNCEECGKPFVEGETIHYTEFAEALCGLCNMKSGVNEYEKDLDELFQAAREENTVDAYMSLPYPFTVYPDIADGGFVASVDDLPGCLTQSDTFEELHEMVIDAMRGWIETTLEDGLEVPLPSKG